MNFIVTIFIFCNKKNLDIENLKFPVIYPEKKDKFVLLFIFIILKLALEARMLRLINLRHRFPHRIRRTSEGATARDARRQAARGRPRTRHFTEPSS